MLFFGCAFFLCEAFGRLVKIIDWQKKKFVQIKMGVGQEHPGWGKAYTLHHNDMNIATMRQETNNEEEKMCKCSGESSAITGSSRWSMLWTLGCGCTGIHRSGTCCLTWWLHIEELVEIRNGLHVEEEEVNQVDEPTACEDQGDSLETHELGLDQ